jgi:hypothetical protein
MFYRFTNFRCILFYLRNLAKTYTSSKEIRLIDVSSSISMVTSDFTTLFFDGNHNRRLTHVTKSFCLESESLVFASHPLFHDDLGIFDSIHHGDSILDVSQTPIQLTQRTKIPSMACVLLL